jgi:hypothetical protein
VADAHGEAVALVVGAPFRSPTQALEHAHLLAAAPALLAACKAALTFVHNPFFDSPGELREAERQVGEQLARAVAAAIEAQP